MELNSYIKPKIKISVHICQVDMSSLLDKYDLMNFFYYY